MRTVMATLVPPRPPQRPPPASSSHHSPPWCRPYPLQTARLRNGVRHLSLCRFVLPVSSRVCAGHLTVFAYSGPTIIYSTLPPLCSLLLFLAAVLSRGAEGGESCLLSSSYPVTTAPRSLHRLAQLPQIKSEKHRALALQKLKEDAVSVRALRFALRSHCGMPLRQMRTSSCC